MWSHQWQNILWSDLILCKSYLSLRRNIWTQVASSLHRKYYEEENGQEYLCTIDVQEQFKSACNKKHYVNFKINLHLVHDMQCTSCSLKCNNFGHLTKKKQPGFCILIITLKSFEHCRINELKNISNRTTQRKAYLINGTKLVHGG